MTVPKPYAPARTYVMLLAAGHGKRMLPLTKNKPKPLLNVGAKSLIEHHLGNLAAQGFVNIVINIAYLGHQIQQVLGNGQQFGLEITYSDETTSGALETAGGIRNALPLIHSDPFLVINADIYTNFITAPYLKYALAPLNSSGRLIMVDNPKHNSTGDFVIDKCGLLREKQHLINQQNTTFSGIALYKKSIFEQVPSGAQALAPVFQTLIKTEMLEAYHFKGAWTDVGTPERLAKLNNSN